MPDVLTLTIGGVSLAYPPPASAVTLDNDRAAQEVTTLAGKTVLVMSANRACRRITVQSQENCFMTGSEKASLEDYKRGDSITLSEKYTNGTARSWSGALASNPEFRHSGIIDEAGVHYWDYRFEILIEEA
jgi:hypothetical protein